MARSCAIIPRIKKPNGEKVESKLYKDLLSHTLDRDGANKIYSITKSPEFIEEWQPTMELDENGEPTIESLIKKGNLNEVIPEMKVLERLNKDIGFYKERSTEVRYYENTPEQRNKLADKAVEFNAHSPFKEDYVATVTPTDITNQEITIQVEKKSAENTQIAEKIRVNQTLNTTLRQILEEKGITVGHLTDLEESLGINGVADFDKANNAAEGLIELIRLADGERGEAALPEEFAHTALRMLGKHPLKERLFNTIVQNNLAETILGEQYQDYLEKYNGDELLLAEEAAGKLVAKHLLNGEPAPKSFFGNLVKRVIDAIKSFFSRISAEDIRKAQIDANRSAAAISKGIMDRSLVSQMQRDNIEIGHQLYDLGERIKRDKDILQKTIDTSIKTYALYEQKNPNAPFNVKQAELVQKLEQDLQTNNECHGILTFVEHGVETLQQLTKRIEKLSELSTLNEKCKVLRNIRNFYHSYSTLVDVINIATLKEASETDDRYGEIRPLVNEFVSLLQNVRNLYQDATKPLFIETMKSVIGEDLVIPFGKHKGEKITIEQLVHESEDISLFDRWLDSASDSSSLLIKVFDQIIKKAKHKGRMRTIVMSKRIQELGVILEQLGIRNFEWMFEKDSQGHKTGNYIGVINYAKYQEAKDKFYESLNKKYGENPVGRDLENRNKEIKEWYEENLEEVGGKKQPKMYDSNGRILYASEDYINMNDAQRAFYNAIMEIKAELDGLLPENYTHLHNAVKIRKNLLERVKSSDSVVGGAKQLWEAVKDDFIRRSDDIDMGYSKKTDFEKHEVQTLPIYYTKMKEGESADDISTDVVSTMISYAAMAYDYAEMNEVIDALENARDYLRDNLEVTQAKDKKSSLERFEALGRKVEGFIVKGQSDNRILQRLDDLFTMQVYGRYRRDEGQWGKIDRAKTGDFIAKLTALNMLGLNLLSGISNVATGKVMMRIEAVAKQFFSETSVLKADRIYGSQLHHTLGEIGQRVKTSKLALWDELFNVLQDYEQVSKEVNWARKSRFAQLYGTNALFALNNSGEHWMQNRTSLACAMEYKMKRPDGTITNLWDAMEVVYIDPNNKKKGAKLQVKEGYTKEDGTEFTSEDVYAFERKVTKINQRMHGIYNKLDRSAVQQYSVGRLAIMFRKWIRPSYNRRFRGVEKDLDLNEWTEGYYRTTGRFLLELCKNIRETEFTVATYWDSLDPREKENIRRAATEAIHLAVLTAFLAIMQWEDKDKSSYIAKMVEYQCRRLQTEIGAQTPTPFMFGEIFQILKSPSAGVNTLQGVGDLLGLINPWNYEPVGGEEALLKSGRYKGHSRAYKIFFESPVVPMNRTIYKGLHPEEVIPFYKQ